MGASHCSASGDVIGLYVLYVSQKIPKLSPSLKLLLVSSNLEASSLVFLTDCRWCSWWPAATFLLTNRHCHTSIIVHWGWGERGGYCSDTRPTGNKWQARKIFLFALICLSEQGATPQVVNQGVPGQASDSYYVLSGSHVILLSLPHPEFCLVPWEFSPRSKHAYAPCVRTCRFLLLCPEYPWAFGSTWWLQCKPDGKKVQ